MDKQLLKSKFLGALIGTGLGDSLGAPFEGSPIVRPEDIEKVADKQELLTYTDDTHMMIGEKNRAYIEELAEGLWQQCIGY